MGLGDTLVKALKKAVNATGEFVEAHQDGLKKAGDTVEAKTKEAWAKTKEVGEQALDGAKKAFETAKTEVDKAIKEASGKDGAADAEAKKDDGPKAGPQ